jgi:transglutaminase-like putative cysteine protease
VASSERTSPARRERQHATAQLSLSLAAWVGVLAAMVPLVGVIVPGAWMAGVAVITGAVFAAGFIARWYRLPAVLVAVIELALWIAMTTAIFLRDLAIVFVIPTLHAFAAVPDKITAALHQIQVGFAPLAASPEVAFCLVTAAGLVAIVVDHVAVTARMPLAAAIALVAVSLIPSLAVPAPFDVLAFVLLAVAILFLLRVETRTRYQPPHAAPVAPSSTSAIAVSIGLVAVLVAVAATPLLPEPVARAAFGPGGSTINASLDLGRDLRRPDPVTVLTLRTSASSAPYLRVASLSSFDDAVWQPDIRPTTPISDPAGFGPETAERGIAVEKVTTTIRIDKLRAQYLPVPFPAVSVTGAPEGWNVMGANRTVISDGTLSTASGEEYTVTTEVPDPTLEQIRASTAHVGDVDTIGLPVVVPQIISEDAHEVTKGTTNDYDALTALQAWFRGPSFEYSLSAPAKQGFDASGVSSVADFLRVREGYCVHFASAFAIMARVLGMSSRVVVGYLPGTAETTSIPEASSPVYTVSSSQLHSWPEVYFAGIGWVPFEPTKSLGDPTSFLPEAAGSGNDVTPTTKPSSEPSATQQASQRPDAGAVGADDGRSDANAGVNLLPWGVGTGAVIVLLLVPMLLGIVRRRRQDAAARGGDALAAWSSVRDAAIDVGIAVPVTESPRAFAARLVHEHGAPSAETSVLVHAVEAAAYAPGGAPPGAESLERAVRAVRNGLYLSVPGGRRGRALLFPRSLVVRPGSVYARDGASAVTR